MTTLSVTSSKREKTVSELKEAIEAFSALNDVLRSQLEALQAMMRNVRATNENYKQLVKVNSQWIDLLNAMK